MIERVQISNTTYASGNQKFEAGTPPIVQAIGFSAAIVLLVVGLAILINIRKI